MFWLLNIIEVLFWLTSIKICTFLRIYCSRNFKRIFVELQKVARNFRSLLFSIYDSFKKLCIWTCFSKQWSGVTVLLYGVEGGVSIVCERDRLCCFRAKGAVLSTRPLSITSERHTCSYYTSRSTISKWAAAVPRTTNRPPNHHECHTNWVSWVGGGGANYEELIGVDWIGLGLDLKWFSLRDKLLNSFH